MSRSKISEDSGIGAGVGIFATIGAITTIVLMFEAGSCVYDWVDSINTFRRLRPNIVTRYELIGEKKRLNEYIEDLQNQINVINNERGRNGRKGK